MTLKLTKTSVATTKSARHPSPEEVANIRTTIQKFTADLADIKSFLNISFSPSRNNKIEEYLECAQLSLSKHFNFDLLSQDEKVDYLLLQSHIRRLGHHNKAAAKKYHQAGRLGLLNDWVDECIQFVETRHAVKRQSGQQIATIFQNAEKGINSLIKVLHSEDSFHGDKERFIVFWSIARFEELTGVLEEAVDFYRGYDPLISWWIEEPWRTLSTKLATLSTALGDKVGVNGPSSADDIVGDPIGREALLEELEAEWIAYTPEELIRIGEEEMEWCEKEMEKASKALGFESHQDALEHVKNNFVEPGDQIHVSACNLFLTLTDPLLML